MMDTPDDLGLSVGSEDDRGEDRPAGPAVGAEVAVETPRDPLHEPPVRARGWIRDLAACLLLVALVLLFYWRILTPDLADRQSLAPGDFVLQFYAFDRVEAEQVLQGRLPLWNPYNYSGHPFLADVQAAVFYPPSLLTVLLSGARGVSVFALELEVVLHFLLAALFTYSFARRVIGHRGAALLSAIAFAFGGYLTGYPPLQFAILKTDVWLPLILLCLEVGVERLEAGQRRARPAFLGAGLAFGIAILAGHPQSALFVLYASLAYIVFRTWRTGTWRHSIAGIGLFLLVGLSLSAAQWFPSLEYMLLSSRGQLGYEDLSNGFALTDLLLLVLPSRSPLYAGVLPLLLALIVPLLDRSRAVLFWAGQGLAALLLSLGGNLFVYSLFYLLVPGFGLFRSQERAAFLLSFALAMLAGYGLARLLTRPVPDWLRRTANRLVAGTAGLTAIAYVGWLAGGQAELSPFRWFLQQSIYLLLLLMGFSLLLRWLARGGMREGVLAATVALVVLDLFTANAAGNLNPSLPEEHISPPPLVQQMLADPDRFRVYGPTQLPANFGCLFGLESVWGASPLRLERYRRFFEEVPKEFVWRLLNVKYVVEGSAELNVPSTVVATETRDNATIYLHRLAEPGPRAWVVHEIEVIPDDDDVVARLSDWRFSPFKAAILPADPGLSPGQIDEDLADSSVQWVQYEPSRLVLDVTLPADGLLVLSEVHYPGWESRVDGEKAPTLRTDLVLRGVPVPEGTHRVEMTFRPASVFAGLSLSSLTLVAVLACLLFLWRKRG